MIEINENSSIPIYQQIYENLIRLIVLKIMSEGEKLPSVRELALQLKINPNTIQKAYKVLETDEYVTAQQGKGNFISPYEKVIKVYGNSVEAKMKGNLKALMTIGKSRELILKEVTNMLEALENDRD